MANPIFSNNIKMNEPQLTYATPKAMPSESNSLEGVANMANQIIPTAMKFDKQGVMREASDLANEMSNDYKLGSETHINNLVQEKARLESDLNTGGDNAVITERLDIIESKLSSAKEQGKIGPGEFRHRMMLAAQQLTSENPAYQLEITNRMNQVFGATGINDLVALDSTLLKTRVDAQIARRNLKIKAIEQYEDTTGRSNEWIDDQFNMYKEYEGSMKQTKQIVDHLKNADEIEKARAYEVFKSNGGFASFTTGLMLDTRIQARAIETDPNMKIDEKVRQMNMLITRQQNLTLSLASRLPSWAKDGELMASKIVTQLEVVKKELLDSENKVHEIAKVGGTIKLLQHQRTEDLMSRFNLTEVKAKMDIVTALTNLKTANPQKFQQIERMGSETINNLLLGLSQNKVDDIPGAEEYRTLPGAMELNALTNSQHKNMAKTLKEDGKLSEAHTDLYIGSLSIPASSLSKDAKVEFYDKTLSQTILGTDDAVLEELSTNAEFDTVLDSALTFYTDAARQSLFALSQGQILNVKVNKSNSSLFLAPDDPIRESNPELVTRIENNFTRINKLARINAKISGNSIKDEFTQIIEEDFNTFLKVK